MLAGNAIILRHCVKYLLLYCSLYNVYFDGIFEEKLFILNFMRFSKIVGCLKEKGISVLVYILTEIRTVFNFIFL